MAILPVIIAPDSRLKKICVPVDRVDEAMRRLMDDMLETMYRAPGIGLAAPQVGVMRRVIVVDATPSGEERRLFRMANPELVSISEERIVTEEGCLSLPEHYAEVKRPGQIRVRYIDEDNAVRELDAKDTLATCIQHEMDHLDGVLFVDHLSVLKRNIILRKLAKTRKAVAMAGA